MTPRFARALLFFIAILVYTIDRTAKLLAVKMLYAGESIRVLPGIFHITLILNKGAAFGLLRGHVAFFSFVAAAAMAAIIVYAWKARTLPLSIIISLGFIMGGALGNLVDRVKFGCVIDFLDFRVWPVFNVADSAISVGVGLLILHLMLKRTRPA